MGDPGNPEHGAEPGSEPNPEQPGWAAPNLPPPPPAPTPPPPPYGSPPPQPAAPQPQPQWGTPPPAWGAPPPGGPVPPGGAGGGWQPTGAPVKKRRLTWLWILIPVLVILVTSTVVVGVYAVRLAVEPIDATNEYLADLSAGRYGAASENLCRFALVGGTNALERQQQRDNELGRITAWDIDGIEFPNDGTSELIDVFTTGSVVRNGVTYDIRVGLSREDDEWKVCTVSEK
jgi:hypothetical protein